MSDNFTLWLHFVIFNAVPDISLGTYNRKSISSGVTRTLCRHKQQTAMECRLFNDDFLTHIYIYICMYTYLLVMYLMTLYHTESNDKMINKRWIGKDIEGSHRGLICGDNAAFSWRYWEK
jgi:hypothetical protein